MESLIQRFSSTLLFCSVQHIGNEIIVSKVDWHCRFHCIILKWLFFLDA